MDIGGTKARIFLVLLMTLFSSCHVYVHAPIGYEIGPEADTIAIQFFQLSLYLDVAEAFLLVATKQQSYLHCSKVISLLQTIQDLKLNGTIYTVQKGNVNLLTKPKEILDCSNVKDIEKPTWINEISFCLHAPSLYFEH